jgi:hypothetical protein
MITKELRESSVDGRSHWLIRMGRGPGRVSGPVIACVALLLFALAPSIGHALHNSDHDSPTIVGSWFTTVRPLFPLSSAWGRSQQTVASSTRRRCRWDLPSRAPDTGNGSGPEAVRSLSHS